MSKTPIRIGAAIPVVFRGHSGVIKHPGDTQDGSLFVPESKVSVERRAKKSRYIEDADLDEELTDDNRGDPQYHPIKDRWIYLFSDVDPCHPDRPIHLAYILLADVDGRVSMRAAHEGIDEHYTGEPTEVFSLPYVFGQQRIRYIAVSTRIGIPYDVADKWISEWNQKAEWVGDYIDQNIGWVDIAAIDQYEDFADLPECDPESGTHIPIFPVLEPMDTAVRLARRVMRAVEVKTRYFTDKESKYSESGKRRYARYLLAEALKNSNGRDLRHELRYDEARWKINAEIELVERDLEKRIRALDLRGRNLAGWMQRDFILSWFDLCFEHGLGDTSLDRVGKYTDPTRESLLEDLHEVILALQETRQGLLVIDIWDTNRKFSIINSVVFSNPISEFLKTPFLLRATSASIVGIKKVVMGRSISMARSTYKSALAKERIMWDEGAKVFIDDEKFGLVSVHDRSRISNSYTRDVLDSQASKIARWEERMVTWSSASDVISMLGWFAVCEAIRVHGLQERSQSNKFKDDVSKYHAITAQIMVTAELIMANALQGAPEAAIESSKKAIGSMGAVLNIVDGVLKYASARELVEKGDGDAGLLLGASAAFSIVAGAAVPYMLITIGVAGLSVVPPLLIAAGVFAVLSDACKDSGWMTFLKCTFVYEFRYPPIGVPDWGHDDSRTYSYNEIKADPRAQLLCFDILLKNFNVKMLGGSGYGGNIGPMHPDFYGANTLRVRIRTDDPFSVFYLEWKVTEKVYSKDGTSEKKVTYSRQTITSRFGFEIQTDPQFRRILGDVKAPNGLRLFEFPGGDILEQRWDDFHKALLIGQPRGTEEAIGRSFFGERATVTVQRLVVPSLPGQKPCWTPAGGGIPLDPSMGREFQPYK